MIEKKKSRSLKVFLGGVIVVSILSLLVAPSAAQYGAGGLKAGKAPNVQLTRERVERFMAQLAKSHPGQARALKELRQENPEQFRKKIRQIAQKQMTRRRPAGPMGRGPGAKFGPGRGAGGPGPGHLRRGLRGNGSGRGMRGMHGQRRFGKGRQGMRFQGRRGHSRGGMGFQGRQGRGGRGMQMQRRGGGRGRGPIGPKGPGQMQPGPRRQFRRGFSSECEGCPICQGRMDGKGQGRFGRRRGGGLPPRPGHGPMHR